MVKRIIAIANTLLVLAILIPTKIDAASLSISASSKTVTVGKTVTIKVSQSDLAGKFSVTTSNPSVLSGGVSSDKFTTSGESRTYEFTAKSVGTAKITVNALDLASFSDEKKYSTSKSITINVVKPREKSTNNNLKSLSVDGYSISPSFNKNTLEYTVNLESNVEKIKINATKEDGYASVSGTGEKQVQEGDNKFEITVTSETGKSKVYTLNAVVKDSNPIIKEIDGKNYTVIKRASALTGPDQFEAKTVTINETEIPAFYNEITKTTLVGLKDEQGTIHLFKYDNEKDSYSKYESLTSVSKTIIFESTDEEIDGYEKINITIDDKEYTGYQANNKDYVLVYGMDIETGNKDWYLYNIKEKTIQTYMNDNTDNVQEKLENRIEEYKIVLLGMIGLSLLLLLIIIIQIVSKNKMKKKLLKRLQAKEKLELKKEETIAKKVEPEQSKKKETKKKSNTNK